MKKKELQKQIYALENRVKHLEFILKIKTVMDDIELATRDRWLDKQEEKYELKDATPEVFSLRDALDPWARRYPTEDDQGYKVGGTD